MALLVALPLLGEVFWLAAGDVFAPDFRFDVAAAEAFAASGMLAHLWLVPNPAHTVSRSISKPISETILSASAMALMSSSSLIWRYTWHGSRPL